MKNTRLNHAEYEIKHQGLKFCEQNTDPQKSAGINAKTSGGTPNIGGVEKKRLFFHPNNIPIFGKHMIFHTFIVAKDIRRKGPRRILMLY